LAPRQKPVFINCPFDGDYLPFFHAIVFTVLRCGFKPRCALEIVDAGQTRIARIEKLSRTARSASTTSRAKG
jgi:hypothetical protein